MLRILSAAFITIACMCSCSPGNDEDNITLLKEVNNSLIQSNGITRLSTNNIFESLKGKTRMPETSDRATKWLVKAEKIRQLTNDIIKHIEKIKSDLIEEAGFDPVKEEKPKSARQAVDHIFNEHKEGQLLHEKLALYKRDLLVIADDSAAIETYMKNSIVLMGTDMISKESAFADRYFNTTVLGAITMLNKIENDIRVTENRLVTLYNEQTSYHDWMWPDYYAIVTQNANVVRPGDNMQILAGIGAFSTEVKPEVVIEGKEVPLTTLGYSLYNFKASANPGVYRVPVRIKYFDQVAGKKVETERIIEYTVKSD